MEASSLCTKPLSCHCVFDRNRVFVQPPALIISRKLAQRRRYRDGEDDTEEARELPADYESEDHKERRYADDPRYDQWIDEVIFKLRSDQIQRDDNETERKPSRGKADGARYGAGEYHTKNRDNFRDSRKYSERGRVRHAKYHESEECDDTHDDRKEKLPLHPKADLVLRATPEADHVRLMFLRRDDAKEVIYARINDREVKRKHHDENKRKDAAEDDRDSRERLGEIRAHIQNREC